MERRLILTWVLLLCAAAMAPCRGYYSDSKPYVPRREKVTKLHFYYHDTISGKNPTAVLVARPNFPTAFNNTSTPFGSVYVTDDPLTVGPNLTSEIIGNARGMWASSGQDELTVVAYWDFGFTKGKFNGSSISVFSRNTVTQPGRELAVVGGRGKFRMAKGFVQLYSHFVDFTTGDVIVECNVTVIHH